MSEREKQVPLVRQLTCIMTIGGVLESDRKFTPKIFYKGSFNRLGQLFVIGVI
jgi:hypothetical protein